MESQINVLSKPGKVHQRGFTLVELLVTIAIMTILLAILTPGVINSIRSAELAVCSSRMSQIGVAGQTLRQELDGRFPSSMMIKANMYQATAVDNYHYETWAKQFGYNSLIEAMEANVLSCPTSLRVGEQQGFPQHDGFSLMTYSGNRELWWSSSFNDRFFESYNKRLPERYPEIRRPVRCMLAVCNDGRWWKAADGKYFGQQPTFFHGDDTVANMPHLNFMNGRCNVLFIDGHVSAMKPGWGADASNPAGDQIPCERTGDLTAWNLFWNGK